MKTKLYLAGIMGLLRRLSSGVPGRGRLGKNNLASKYKRHQGPKEKERRVRQGINNYCKETNYLLNCSYK